VIKRRISAGVRKAYADMSHERRCEMDRNREIGVRIAKQIKDDQS
jgi:hypothetical protein